MTLQSFDLETAIATAEAGDVAAWEDIARHLLKVRAKPKTRKSKSSVQTWAHTMLADGREYVTSHYAGKDEAATLSAHAAYAMHKASMEHLEFVPSGQYIVANAVPARKPAFCHLLTDPAEIEERRDWCFEARMERHRKAGRLISEDEQHKSLKIRVAA